MRRLLLAIFLSAALLPLHAQNLRTVKGLVADESGLPVSGAVLKVNGVDGEFTSDRMGRFEFKVPLSSTTITAFKDGYPSASVEIAGTYVLVRLLKNVPSAPVAVKPVTKPVETEPAAPKDTVKKDTVKKDKEKKDKEKKEKSTAETSREKTKTSPKSAKISDDAGFACSIDLSYAYNFRHSMITHTNVGEQPYGTFHPLELTAGFGYRFNKTFTLLAGGGFMYNLVTPDRLDSIDESTYPGISVRKWDIPAFLALKVSFCNGTVRPLLLAQGGIYAMSLAPYAELGAGIGIRTGGTTSLNILFSAKNNPWQYFTVTSYKGYPFSVAPSVKIGFSF